MSNIYDDLIQYFEKAKSIILKILIQINVKPVDAGSLFISMHFHDGQKDISWLIFYNLLSCLFYSILILQILS